MEKTKEKENNFAVIKTGGNQYKVTTGEKVNIGKIDVKEGDTIKFEKTLLKNIDGKVEIGTPYLEDQVEAKLIKNGREDKKIVFKYHAKTRYSKKKGHRQDFSQVEITKI
ncbi:MAG: 50S ribosomal protein L21 [Candidatus Paceibacterota bacterium]